MSASAPPRARSVVNAWCPGVSIKSSPGILIGIFSIEPLIMRIASMGTIVAPMCWVIAPASEATTDEPRIRSSKRGLAVIHMPHDAHDRRPDLRVCRHIPSLPFARALKTVD